MSKAPGSCPLILAGEESARATIAFPGEPGAYAHEACLRFLPGALAIPKASFSAALDAVQHGETDCAMLPLENNIAGAVPGVTDLIKAKNLHVRARYRMPVRLHVLALPRTWLVDVVMIASHPMAVAQCRSWLIGSGFEIRLEENTASAARKLASGGDGTLAVIASEAAARIYDLHILVHDLQDRPDNATTFGLVARTGEQLQ